MTRVQSDIVPAVKTWLDSRITDADVRLNVPDKWKTADGPILVVADDGGPTMWPAMSRHTLRLTAYAAGRTQARAIVAKACGLLGFGRPPGLIHINSDMSSILDSRDSNTGAMIASALITATSRLTEV